MKVTREFAVAAVLLAVVLGSAAYLAYVSYNYDTHYWEARSAILSGSNANVDRLTITKDQASGNVIVTVAVSVTNPTGYSGLILNQFQVVLFFDHNGNYSESVFYAPRDNLLANTTPNVPLGPMSTVNGTLTAHLDSAQSSIFETFNQTYTSGVYAHTVLTVDVSSFLDPVFGMMNPSKIQEIRLS